MNRYGRILPHNNRFGRRDACHASRFAPVDDLHGLRTSLTSTATASAFRLAINPTVSRSTCVRTAPVAAISYKTRFNSLLCLLDV